MAADVPIPALLAEIMRSEGTLPENAQIAYHQESTDAEVPQPCCPTCGRPFPKPRKPRAKQK